MDKKVFYIISFILAVVVFVLNLLDILSIINWSWLSKLTTILINIELLLISIMTWKENKIISSIIIGISLILIVVTIII